MREGSGCLPSPFSKGDKVHTLRAIHDEDGEVVIFDTYFDTEHQNERLIYYKSDGTIGSAAKNKFVIQEKQI